MVYEKPRFDWTPRNDTERMVAEIRAMLTVVEVDAQAKYPDVPDYANCASLCARIADVALLLKVHVAEMAPPDDAPQG